MLVGLTFFSVCGGPFGTEGAVNAGGAFFALAGFILMPIVWSLPQGGVREAGGGWA